MRFCIVGLVGALGVLGICYELWAHAYLVSADPPAGASLEASPEKIVLVFSEEIDPNFSSFDLYDAQGQLLQRLSFVTQENRLRVVLTLPKLSNGAYTVAWKVLSSIDGHTTTGVLPLGIGVGSKGALSMEAKLDLLRILVRWGRLLALMTFAGTLVFVQLIAKERFSALRVLWGVAVLFSLSELALYANSVGELNAVWGTRVGMTLSAQIAMLFITGIVWARGGAWSWLGLALSLAAVAAGAWSSHSAAAKDTLALIFEIAHLVTVAIWAGGLLALGLLVREQATSWNGVLVRFSRLALLSVVVLVGSGVYLSFRHVGSLSALWSTDYGRFLLVKLALLTAILAMAALNFRQVRRDFRGEYGRRDLAPLHRRVWGEFFVVVLVLGAASALALSAPPRAGHSSSPAVLVGESDGLRITLIVSSVRVEPAHFAVQLQSRDGRSVTEHVQRVTLEFRHRDGLGAVSAFAEPTSAGDFALHGLYLSVAGQWEITVRVRLSDRAEDIITIFEVQAFR